METQGRKEITEAVAIAALSAILTGLINWGLGVSKAKAKATPKPEGEKPKA